MSSRFSLSIRIYVGNVSKDVRFHPHNLESCFWGPRVQCGDNTSDCSGLAGHNWLYKGSERKQALLHIMQLLGLNLITWNGLEQVSRGVILILSVF